MTDFSSTLREDFQPVTLARFTPTAGSLAVSLVYSFPSTRLIGDIIPIFKYSGKKVYGDFLRSSIRPATWREYSLNFSLK